jgi:broad specificity phosphatase PhoE
MRTAYFITHPEVMVDPAVDIRRWHLSDAGIRRMRVFADEPFLKNVETVWASTEIKAIEAAGLLAARRGLGISVLHELHENDRSATGFLPPAEFERVADAFFANPAVSIRGWERAVEAQTRITAAVDRVLSKTPMGDVAIVAHGAVGTLLLCCYSVRPISRADDQPFQGHYWGFEIDSRRVIHGWKPIAPR